MAFFPRIEDMGLSWHIFSVPTQWIAPHQERDPQGCRMTIARVPACTLSIVKDLSKFIVGMLFACLIQGCGDDNLRSYDAAVLALEDGRNSAALSDARVASRSTTGIQRDRASYVAGVAASRLGKLDEAKQYLEVAVRSPQAEVAGKANVQLGYSNTQKRQKLWRAGTSPRRGSAQ